MAEIEQFFTEPGNEDAITDIETTATAASGAVNSTTRSSIQQTSSSSEVSSNQQQQQQQLRNSRSPDHQEQQSNQQQMPGSDSTTSNDMGSDVYHHHGRAQTGSQSSGANYHHHHQSRQRTSSAYHNQHQQHQMQHYHHQNKYNNPRGGDSESNVNHVLLLTVINPHYSITCDLIHQIFSAYGKVNRIVIFKKNGVQAMVEFDNVESAKRAKTTLYGCDIYSGCCTLKIEYAKPTRLNIHRNDHDSFDYTNPNLSGGGGGGSGGGGGDGVVGCETSGDGHHPHHHQPHQHHTSSNNQSHGHPIHYASSHSSHHQQNKGGDRQAGGGGGALGVGGHHHRMPQQQHHYHSSRHHHSQSGAPQHQGGQQPPIARSPDMSAPNSNYEASNDQSSDAFHQDGGYSVSRGGGAGGGQQPLTYVVAPDSYMPVHGSAQPQHHHGQPGGNMYSRQDGHQQQQQQQPQHHSTRGGSGGGPPNHSSSYNSAHDVLMGPISLPPPQGTVMMVYGLQPERVNCDKLFNLFCLYGNVVRVKFLKTKEGCAMVQMGDLLSVDRCVNSLNKSTLFGSELQISYSKQAFLHDVMLPFLLPDGSPSYKDYMGNKNNRFKNPEVASKNRILPPSQVLHFFNAPFGITEEELVHLFKETAGHEPISIKIFSPRPDNSKSYSGLVTFKDPAEATDSLVMCNHLSMPKPGAPHPHILRLCFSPPTYMRQSHYGAQTNQ